MMSMQNCIFNIGQIVLSTQGHDKGQRYVVVGIRGDRIAVADGVLKSIKTPKQKNRKHLLATKFIDPEIESKLKDGLEVNDQMIYHTLLKFKKSNKE